MDLIPKYINNLIIIWNTIRSALLLLHDQSKHKVGIYIVSPTLVGIRSYSIQLTPFQFDQNPPP